MNSRGRLFGLVLLFGIFIAGQSSAFAGKPSGSDYRDLSGQLMLDLAHHRQEYPFLATLHLQRHVFRSESGANLSLVYENEKTLSGYGANGVTAYVYIFTGSRSFEQAVNTEQIGELKIVTIAKGPQGKAFQSLMKRIIDDRRRDFASKYSL